MELAFDSKLLRTTCENDELAKKQLGNAVAEALKRRLADLRAAASPKELVAGHPRIVGGENLIVDLCENKHIVLKANHPKNPRTGSNELDWARVSRVKIMGIETERV